MREGRAVGEGDELREGVGPFGAAEEGGVPGLVLVLGGRGRVVEGSAGVQGGAAEWEVGGHCFVWGVCGAVCGGGRMGCEYARVFGR